MDFAEISKLVLQNADRYAKKHGVNFDQDFSVLKLTEEVGELAQAVIVHQRRSRPEKYLPEEESRKNVGDELADVLCFIIVIADQFGVDLEEAIDRKWLSQVRKR